MKSLPYNANKDSHSEISRGIKGNKEQFIREEPRIDHYWERTVHQPTRKSHGGTRANSTEPIPSGCDVASTRADT